MSRTKKYTERELQEGKNWQCILYPDSESYDCNLLLERLSYFWDKFYYIYHDKDTYTELDIDKMYEGNQNEKTHHVGEEKKPHYHVIGRLDHNCTLGRASVKFGIDTNMVERCKSYKSSIQYLIHKNNPEKYQYLPEEIITNDSDNLNKYLKSDLDVTEKAKMIIDFIYSDDNNGTMYAISQFAIKNNCWDELRRGQHIYTMMMNERKTIK